MSFCWFPDVESVCGRPRLVKEIGEFERQNLKNFLASRGGASRPARPGGSDLGPLLLHAGVSARTPRALPGRGEREGVNATVKT